MGQATQSGSLAKADVREPDERKNKIEENDTESGSEDFETQAEGEATALWRLRTTDKKKKTLDKTRSM